MKPISMTSKRSRAFRKIDSRLWERAPVSTLSSAALVPRLSPAVRAPSTRLRNSLKDRKRRGLSAQTVLGVRLWRTVSVALTRVPERLSQGVLRKGFRQGQTLLIVAERSIP